MSGDPPEYDMLRFLEREGGQTDGHSHWVGDWPPPEKLWVAYGHESGLSSVFDLDEIDSEMLLELGKCTSITVHKYGLRSYSQLSERIPGVMRGAEYHREEGQ